MTIKSKLVIVASVFLFISITLMGIGFYVVKDMSDGLTFINYTGQTRYKTYRLAWLMEEHSEGEKGIEPAIRKEMYEFERLLFSLRDGKKEYNIKGARDAEILSSARALDMFNWNKGEVCRALGLTRPRLDRKIRKYKLKPE